jgi:sensor histidine kinase YesM
VVAAQPADGPQLAGGPSDLLGRILSLSYVWRIAVLNLAISLALAVGIWASRGRSGPTLLAEIFTSLIHGTVYGSAFGLGLYYLSRPLALFRRPWNSLATLVAIAATATLASFVTQFLLLTFGYVALEHFWQEFAYKAAVVTIIALLIGWGVRLYESVQIQLHATNLRLKEEEFEKERALKLATEAQLASLESKLHPHFLFNTLNSISALIADNPVLADKVVLRLSRLLRSSLDVVDQSSVSLEEEIKLTVDYLEIEKARFGERLRYSLNVAPELLAIRVPPLILQPIVENSVKFAIFPRPGGGSIAISAQQESGHGLDTLRQRLNTLFQDRATLAIAAAEDRTTVSIAIPLPT